MSQSRSPAGRPLDERTLDEAGQLEVFLEAYRTSLRNCLDGMTDDEVRARLVPSQTTLLGLVKHATFLQVVWYQEAVTGTPRTELGQPEGVDDSFRLTASDTVASVLERYDRACVTARAVTATHLPDTVVRGHRAGAMTLRWIQLQVLRELAHHHGHADILREQLIARRPPGDPAPRSPSVLVLGLDPFRVPGPWDPQPAADGIEQGRARFVDRGVDHEFCLVGLDGSDDVDAVLSAALSRRPWDCVVVGGGIRHDDDLFERVIGLLRQHAPEAAVAFNATPADTYEAAARHVDLP